MPNTFARNEPAVMCYRDGGPRKRSLLDSCLQHGKRTVELLVLSRQSVRQQTFRNLFQKLPLVAFVFGL
jgi:hypothetical protein